MAIAAPAGLAESSTSSAARLPGVRPAALWKAFPLREASAPAGAFLPPRSDRPVIGATTPPAVVRSRPSRDTWAVAAGIVALVVAAAGAAFLLLRGPESGWRRAATAAVSQGRVGTARLLGRHAELTLDRAGRHAEALAAYELALDRTGRHAEALAAYRLALDRTGRHAEALAAYRLALDRADRHAEALAAYERYLDEELAIEHSYVLVLPGRGGWGNRFVEREGDPPLLGEVIFDDGLGRAGQAYVVRVIRRSPLPGDERSCAVLRAL
jgi:hypothetical protein